MPDILYRPNLMIAINTIVEQIIFSTGQGAPWAVGVQVVSSALDPKYRVAVIKEVILSAGPLSSPHLLFVSGVSPKEELKTSGMSVVKDISAVGKNLSDVCLHSVHILIIDKAINLAIILQHATSGPLIFCAKLGFTLDYLNSSPIAAILALLKWLWDGSGPFACMAINSVTFLHSDDTRRVLMS